MNISLIVLTWKLCFIIKFNLGFFEFLGIMQRIVFTGLLLFEHFRYVLQHFFSVQSLFGLIAWRNVDASFGCFSRLGLETCFSRRYICAFSVDSILNFVGRRFFDMISEIKLYVKKALEFVLEAGVLVCPLSELIDAQIGVLTAILLLFVFRSFLHYYSN